MGRAAIGPDELNRAGRGWDNRGVQVISEIFFFSEKIDISWKLSESEIQI